MTDKPRRTIQPWSFKNRLIAALLLCSLAAGVIAFVCAYVASRVSVKDELLSAEHDAAIYALELDQKTALSTEEIVRMATSDNLSLTVLDDTDISLSADLLAQLAQQTVTTVSTGVLDMPVTYVQLTEQVVCISASKHYNLVLAAAVRIIFGVLSFVVVFGLMATLASGRFARPVSQLTQATRQVADGDFTVHLPDCGGGEVGELMRSFNGMTEALSRTSYLQKDFIASISHEFRTPIASISGFARLLQMPGLDESTRREYVDMIAGESARLSRLSDTLLRLSSLEQQATPASMSTFSLDEQLRQIILRQEPVWAVRDIDWQLELDPVTLSSDEELLAQVWINLVQNAVKFSDKGSTVEVRCYQADDVVVEVTDHGIGMDEITAARIFDRFYQADRSRSREGVGLGLCLVKRILDILGGTVKVRSSPGEGSTFRVRLPRTAHRPSNGG